MKPSHILLILVSGVMSGCTFLFLKISVDVFPSPFLAFVRMGFGSAILFLLARVLRGKWPRPPKDRMALLFATFFGAVLLFPLQAWGTSFVPSGTGALIFAMMPLMTALTTTVLRSNREYDPRYLLPSLLLGLSGVAVLVGPEAVDTGHEYLLGAGLLLAGAASGSLSAVQVGRKMANEDALALSAYQLSIAFVMLAPLGLFSLAVRTPDAGASDLIPAIAALVALGVMNSGINYFAYTHLIIEAGATAATYVTFVTPPIAVVLGAVVLGENLDFAVAVSMALIITCLLMLTRSHKRPRPIVEMETAVYPDAAGPLTSDA